MSVYKFRGQNASKKSPFLWFFLAQKAGCEAGLAGQNSLNIRTFSRNLWLMNENPVLGAFQWQGKKLLRQRKK
jgi:hypothetical protein